MATKKAGSVAAESTAASKPAVDFTQRSTGYKVDEPDTRDYPIEMLLGAPRGAERPEAMELAALATRYPVVDQGSTQSCVGQALARAAHVRLLKLGNSSPFPSALALYTFGRAIEPRQSTDSLRDEGSYPRLVMKGAREFGVPSEKIWPLDAAKVNDNPPWDVLQQASAFKLVNYYRIDAPLWDRPRQVARALAAGYPVIFGSTADEDLYKYTRDSRPLGQLNGGMGGHMMCLLGYRFEGGRFLFRGINSWGNDWGDGGLFWADQIRLTEPGSSDFYVIVVQPSVAPPAT